MSANIMDSFSDCYKEPALPPRFTQKASTAPMQASLKRARSQVNGLPRIPDLNGDLLLEVFTHRSIRYPTMNEEFGDTDRLAELGAMALNLITTHCLFVKRPMLKREDMQTQRAETLSEANVDTWLSAYKLREKLRCSPDKFSTLNTPQENEFLFHTYVGAVFFQKGYKTAHQWISQLIDPDSEPPSVSDLSINDSHAEKRMKMDNSPSPSPQPVIAAHVHSPAPQPVNGHGPPPPPPPPPPSDPAPAPPPPRDVPMPYQPPPPAPVQPPASAPVSSVTQAGMAYLPLFNQTASQKRVNVEWPATFSGPSHAGRWSVKCMVNGAERGAGHGASKQLAKEEAAQQAFYAMGWGPRNPPTTSTTSTSSSSVSTSNPSSTSLSPSSFSFRQPPPHTVKQEPLEYSPLLSSFNNTSSPPVSSGLGSSYGPPPPPPPRPLYGGPAGFGSQSSFGGPPPPPPGRFSFGGPPPPPPPPSNGHSPLGGPPPPPQSNGHSPFGGPPPPAPGGPPPFPNPLSPAQPNAPFLPLFNQTASQRRIPVDYPAEFSGPPHAGRWIVKCVVNGVVKGQGTGGSKQLAKEEAARAAFYAMGWAGAAR